mmetsp:Transcript_16557/g.41331  ORF Transcript_16557/g.41331 Transcript_16557/m.41331 type:complete len:236 (-) Transcript_16557:1391-2098(-)
MGLLQLCGLVPVTKGVQLSSLRGPEVDAAIIQPLPEGGSSCSSLSSSSAESSRSKSMVASVGNQSQETPARNSQASMTMPPPLMQTAPDELIMTLPFEGSSELRGFGKSHRQHRRSLNDKILFIRTDPGAEAIEDLLRQYGATGSMHGTCGSADDRFLLHLCTEDWTAGSLLCNEVNAPEPVQTQGLLSLGTQESLGGAVSIHSGQLVILGMAEESCSPCNMVMPAVPAPVNMEA